MKYEQRLQIQICDYLRLQYPGVIFMCDLSSGMKLSIGQAVLAMRMRSSRGLPDLFIATPSKGKNGLFLELKREGTKIFLKNGVTIVTDRHIREQATVLKKLQIIGYEAQFGIGFYATKEIIDRYLHTS